MTPCWIPRVGGFQQFNQSRGTDNEDNELLQ